MSLRSENDGCGIREAAKGTSMKLTNEDKALLLDWGYTEKDFAQIEEAFQKRKTTYSLDSVQITREKALELLGRRQYLAGISRSAFHWTSAQETSDGKWVCFDSSKLFK